MTKLDYQEFRLREYDALRREIELRIAATQRTFTNLLITSGAIWAWLFTPRKEGFEYPQELVVASVPVLLGLGMWWLNRAQRTGIMDISNHIQQIEREFCGPGGSWDTKNNNEGAPRPMDAIRFVDDWSYWIVIAANVAIGAAPLLL